MKYKVGDRVRIKSLDWYRKYANKDGIVVCGNYYFTQNLLKYCGKILMITNVIRDFYVCKDIDYQFSDEMIEGLVEEESEKKLSDESWRYKNIFDPAQYPQSFECPKGYQFVDDNGNVINATKIVLEKKKKDVILTQIDTKVHECCILFCKHCGCGVLRDICISLGTCKEHDEYRTAIRAYLMEGNKR